MATETEILDKVLDFYYTLFEDLFTLRFAPEIPNRLRRDTVGRQVADAAASASQSLSLFFETQQLTLPQVETILGDLARLPQSIALDDIANPNIAPETLAHHVREKNSGTPRGTSTLDAAHREAQILVLQVLTLIGPIMAQWREVQFASTFELLRKITAKLNDIADRVRHGAETGAADQRFELSYRDYLSQRFYRVEADTVRMSTNLRIDLHKLFVMPRLRGRERPAGAVSPADAELMGVAEMRKLLSSRAAATTAEKDDLAEEALSVVRQQRRCVIIGPPGAGKSTFLDWLQLQVANATEMFLVGQRQAIPLLLRVRSLDPNNLPTGADVIAAATDSTDRAALMPRGWIERQLNAGNVLFMLDGLDEVDQTLRDNKILPWFERLCVTHPDCHFLLSSRPAGYSPGHLAPLGFVEYDIQDFTSDDIHTYAQHWCTAVRLARNEAEDEAHREGEKDGNSIVDAFKGNSHIFNLSRNPLMLSAICLVYYFEGGRLPDDRALLYRLCIEGLLHHWDYRRGIRSEFTLNEKLQVCREIAIRMHVKERAEASEADVLDAIGAVVGYSERAHNLLEHIRNRSGVLIERRSGIFAFLHLTFQEYLCALALLNGNVAGHKIEHTAPLSHLWKEVIALYCAIAPLPESKRIIKDIMTPAKHPPVNRPNIAIACDVLIDILGSSKSTISSDPNIIKAAVYFIALSPSDIFQTTINMPPYLNEYMSEAANKAISKPQLTHDFLPNRAYVWLMHHPHFFAGDKSIKTILKWRNLKGSQLRQLGSFLHRYGSDEMLGRLCNDHLFYEAGEKGPSEHSVWYLDAISSRILDISSDSTIPLVYDHAFCSCIKSLMMRINNIGHWDYGDLSSIIERRRKYPQPSNESLRREMKDVLHQFSHLLISPPRGKDTRVIVQRMSESALALAAQF